MTRSDELTAGTGLGDGLPVTGVVAGVGLGETIVRVGDGALGAGEGALADCRQDATKSAAKLKTTTNLWPRGTSRV